MGRPRIVVADDHVETRATIASLLASDFDVVSTVADGQAAVEAVGALYPELVVLDISMPGLNGFEAAARIRDLPDPPRIVFATAYEDASIVSAASALGASAVVRKREMLTELVRQSVGRCCSTPSVSTKTVHRSPAPSPASSARVWRQSQAAVIVATASHTPSIRHQLTAMGVDSQERIEHGQLLMFDADEVLNRLMVGNRPDADCFEDTIDPIVDKAAGSRKRPVEIYGEMVDVLWSSGREDAALSLEIPVASVHRKTQVLASLWLFVGCLPNRGVQHHL